jgi:YkoY family integral membrane protein
MIFLQQFLTDFHLLMGDPTQWLKVLAILAMDAALSGDNSIAINAMVLDLPEKMRNKAVWIGMVLAALFRLLALTLAAFIIRNPWVQIVGGLYLIKLCVDHFRDEEELQHGHRPKKHFLSVLLAIGFLDLSLSLDNVVAVVAASTNMAVIVIGVFASIAMLAVATQIVRKIINRYPSLETAGYLILAFLGVIMLAEHSSEFIFWLGSKVGFIGEFTTLHAGLVEAFHFHVGDAFEILGVALIIFGSIAKEEWVLRKIRSLEGFSEGERR